MRILVYSSKPYTKAMLTQANSDNDHEFNFSDARLDSKTVALAKQYAGICCFVDDSLDKKILKKLHQQGVQLILLRCTGFNNIDLQEAERLGLTVMRVSDYSPHSVAEFAVGMILNLNRKIHRAYNRVHEGNFLLDGLLGFDLFGKTVGVIGTGKIGTVFARVMRGFGCHILAYDINPSAHCEAMGVVYTDLDKLLSQSDIVSLHLPLTPDSFHLINQQRLVKMKRNALLVNTSRGAIVDTHDLIVALKKRQLAGVGLDVYEEESHLFYQDLRDQIIDDDTFARLLSFPNVLITAHQAFFTQEALHQIGETTLSNINDFMHQRDNENTLRPESHIAAISST